MDPPHPVVLMYDSTEIPFPKIAMYMTVPRLTAQAALLLTSAKSCQKGDHMVLWRFLSIRDILLSDPPAVYTAINMTLRSAHIK